MATVLENTVRTLPLSQKVLLDGADSLYHFSAQKGETEEKQQVHHSDGRGREETARPTHVCCHLLCCELQLPGVAHVMLHWSILIPLPPS